MNISAKRRREEEYEEQEGGGEQEKGDCKEPSLWSAAEQGDTETVRQKLDNGANIDGLSALEHASSNGHLELVRLLLDRGASVGTAINYASAEGHVEVVKLLLDRGANVEQMDLDGQTPLCIAAESGHVDVVKLLLERGAKVEYKSEHLLPLTAAAYAGHVEVVRLLLNSGAGVHKLDGNNSYPLSVACAEGHLEVVRVLLDFGADMNRVDEDNYVPLGHAIISGNLEVVKLLEERGVDIEDNWYYFACECEKTEIAKWFFNKRKDAAVSADQFTAACFSLELVELLLARGASISENDSSGCAPLWRAAEYGNADVVALLLDKGVSINDEGARRAVILAAKYGYLEVVNLLLDRGAEIPPDALVVAALNLEVMRLLVERGANVDAEGTSGYNPLILAAGRGIRESVNQLLDMGATIDLKNRSGTTALYSAAQYSSDPATVKILLSRGANINLACNGILPLTIATRHEHFDVVKLLLEEGADLGAERKLVYCKSLKADRMDIVELLIHNQPQIASEEPDSLHMAAKSTHDRSFATMKRLLELGANIDHMAHVNVNTELYIERREESALVGAVTSKQPDKVWYLTLHGANTTQYYHKSTSTTVITPNSISSKMTSDEQTVWEICGDDKLIREALLHFWTPKTHKLHQIWIRDAILCVLLVAKRQQWPFHQPVMWKILSHVAFGWYKPRI